MKIEDIECKPGDIIKMIWRDVVQYSGDNLFAVFVMAEKERQWHFNYTETHPKEPNTLGIYNLIGYKIKET